MCAALILGSSATLSAAAPAVPSAPVSPLAPAPAPDIDTVRKQIEQLERQTAKASEEYNATSERLKGAGVAVEAANERLKQQQARVALAQQALGRVAAETYKTDGLDGLLLLLDDDPQALMAVGGLRTTLGERQARGVQALVREQSKLAEDSKALTDRQAELRTGQANLAKQKKTVETKLAQTQAILDRLTDQQQSALRRLNRGMDSGALADLGVKVPADGKLTCDGVGIQAPDARTAKVIAFACAQLGKPYRWGAEGPGSYDCSGLTMAAWSAAGVSLPHNAAMQSNRGTRVSMSELRPGDLLFFYSPISHNGIYIGKGLMVHAPQSGDVVKIASARLDNRLTAAVRL